MPSKRTVEDRFWSKVDTSGNGCWLHTGRLHCGYARFGQVYAHRIAWELIAGPVPKGLYVLHTCDVRHCMRNDEAGWYEIRGVLRPRRGHLWLGTYADNVQDMWNKSRHVKPNGQVNPKRGADHWARLKPELILRGDTHPRAKLTAAIVIECRRLVASGNATVPELAAHHGVAVPVMRRAVNGQNWSHVLP